MNNGWLGFSLSSSAARGYGDGAGGGSGGSGDDGEGSCSSSAAASPLVAMPLQSDGALQYAPSGKFLIECGRARIQDIRTCFVDCRSCHVSRGTKLFMFFLLAQSCCYYVSTHIHSGHRGGSEDFMRTTNSQVLVQKVVKC